jgi:hypothetical protein
MIVDAEKSVSPSPRKKKGRPQKKDVYSMSESDRARHYKARAENKKKREMAARTEPVIRDRVVALPPSFLESRNRDYMRKRFGGFLPPITAAAAAAAAASIVVIE